MLTSTAMDSMRRHLVNNIAFARYVADGTEYTVPITSAEILADNRIAVSFTIAKPESGSRTITEVKLLDFSERVWARKNENITITSAQEGIAYRFRFSVLEN